MPRCARRHAASPAHGAGCRPAVRTGRRDDDRAGLASSARRTPDTRGAAPSRIRARDRASAHRSPAAAERSPQPSSEAGEPAPPTPLPPVEPLPRVDLRAPQEVDKPLRAGVDCRRRSSAWRHHRIHRRSLRRSRSPSPATPLGPRRADRTAVRHRPFCMISRRRSSLRPAWLRIVPAAPIERLAAPAADEELVAPPVELPPARRADRPGADRPSAFAADRPSARALAELDRAESVRSLGGRTARGSNAASRAHGTFRRRTAAAAAGIRVRRAPLVARRAPLPAPSCLDCAWARRLPTKTCSSRGAMSRAAGRLRRPRIDIDAARQRAREIASETTRRAASCPRCRLRRKGNPRKASRWKRRSSPTAAPPTPAWACSRSRCWWRARSATAAVAGSVGASSQRPALKRDQCPISSASRKRETMLYAATVATSSTNPRASKCVAQRLELGIGNLDVAGHRIGQRQYRSFERRECFADFLRLQGGDFRFADAGLRATGRCASNSNGARLSTATRRIISSRNRAATSCGCAPPSASAPSPRRAARCSAGPVEQKNLAALGEDPQPRSPQAQAGSRG